jgi:ribonuclease BN (tRNA processing enzyme)
MSDLTPKPKIGPGPQHSSAMRVGRFAEGAGVRNLVLTHFSPRYQDGGPLPLPLALALALLEKARAVWRQAAVGARSGSLRAGSHWRTAAGGRIG